MFIFFIKIQSVTESQPENSLTFRRCHLEVLQSARPPGNPGEDPPAGVQQRHAHWQVPDAGLAQHNELVGVCAVDAQVELRHLTCTEAESEQRRCVSVVGFRINFNS